MKKVDKGIVSIIIRTKNEETWISQCLSAVYAQNYKNIEVILVDNNSSDMTIKKASKFPLKITYIDEFKPGKAINKGIEMTTGKYIVCLSGHCIPADEYWLGNLIEKLDEEDIAGVYGRQLPTPQTSAVDARDLYLVFGLDSRSQYNDSFFHNANSAFRREIWEKNKFCETTTNIEDRLWGEEVINAGLRIYYEASAKVFHWHGIHHGGDVNRANKIHSIISTIPSLTNSYEWASSQYRKKICAFLPVLAESIIEEPVNLLKRTIDQLDKIKCVDQIYISTDSQEIIDESMKTCKKVRGILRKRDFSSSKVSLDEVIKEFVFYLDQTEIIYDLISIFQISYPLRNLEHVQELFRECKKMNHETVRVVVRDARYLETQMEQKDNDDQEHFLPKSKRKNEAIIELPGYCLITTPNRIRESNIYKKPVFTSYVPNSVTALAIQTKEELELISPILKQHED